LSPMPNLLSVVASPRGDYSISRALTAHFVETWKQNHPGSTVQTRDLFTTKLPFIDLPWIAGAYTPVEQHSPEMTEALAIGNELIAELQAADHIVIGTPMYNFATPAILKAWIDHIVRIGVTFTSSYEGLLKNKKVTVIVASGGVYTPGSPTESYNAETGYLKQIFGFIGLTDVTFILAGGTSAVAMGKVKQEELIAQYVPAVVAAAA
jgi:FMN-dependent NADH-azoreductase